MNSNLFWSILAPHISGFIRFKRSLGFKYKVEERTLYAFDQLLLDQGHTSPWITKEISDKWAERRHNEAKLTTYNKVK